MSRIYKKLIGFLIILFPILFTSFLIASADFSIENWLFYKNIILPEGLVEEKNPIAVKLDDEVFRSAKSNFEDLRIIEEDKEVPFQVIRKGAGGKGEEEVAREGEIINPSSVKTPIQEKGFGSERMLDRNKETYFQNDYLREPKEASFVIDLKRKTLTSKIMILSTDAENTWTSIKIEGSDDKDYWQAIKEKTFIPFSSRREIAYPESNYRYLKLSFEHTGSLKVHELEVYTSIYSPPEVYLLFIGEKGKDYEFYYGNDLATMPPYEVGKLSLETAFWGSLSKEYINPKGKTDYDKDNIANEKDNCPFNFNPDQKDTDGDRLGDTCDNCSTLKNPNQLDSNNNKIGNVCEDDDKDGILNLVDNCPNYSNPNQKDENSNGIGDACEDFDNDGIINDKDNCENTSNYNQADKDKDGIGDACDPVDDRWTEKYPWLLWGTIGVVIIVIGFFAYRLLRKIS